MNWKIKSKDPFVIFKFVLFINFFYDFLMSFSKI